MTKEEAKEKFRLADRLFNESQFGPALKVLTELNAAFPNERNVLYPMARCLTGLGRNAEALDLADRIVRQFDYGPAVDLYKRLKAMKTGDGIGMLDSSSDPVELPPGVLKFDSGPIELPGGIQKFDSDPPRLPSNLDSLLDGSIGSRSAPPPPLPASSGASWQPVALWVGLLVFTFGAWIAIGTTSGRSAVEWQIAYSEAQANGEPLEEFEENIPWGALATFGCAGILFSYVLSVFVAYFALKAVEALPFNDFGEDMKDIALYTLYFFLLSILFFIGWLIFLVILRKHYELSGLKQLAVVALWLVMVSVLSFVAQFMLGVAIGLSAS